jgi:hypothetical protein
MDLQLELVLAFALVGGVFGWRTSRKQRRSLYDEKPVGMSDEAYARRQQRRHLVRRVFNAFIYALVGAAIGWAIALYLRLR